MIAIVLVVLTVILAARRLGHAARSPASPARELYARRLREGPPG